VNLTNLVLQIVAVGTIAIGVVLVLLIGEIDLSVGAVSGFGAAVVAVQAPATACAPVAIVAGLGGRGGGGGDPRADHHPHRDPLAGRHPRGAAELAGGPAVRPRATPAPSTSPTRPHRDRRLVRPPTVGWLLVAGTASWRRGDQRQRWRRGA
jgi:hypothetical protein